MKRNAAEWQRIWEEVHAADTQDAFLARMSRLGLVASQVEITTGTHYSLDLVSLPLLQPRDAAPLQCISSLLCYQLSPQLFFLFATHPGTGMKYSTMASSILSPAEPGTSWPPADKLPPHTWPPPMQPQPFYADQYSPPGVAAPDLRSHQPQTASGAGAVAPAADEPQSSRVTSQSRFVSQTRRDAPPSVRIQALLSQSVARSLRVGALLWSPEYERIVPALVFCL